MRILVFGGSGFLGNRLLPMLVARDHEVIAPRSAEVDLLNPVPERDDFRDIDAVIHAAAIYGGMPFDIEHQAHVLASNTRINLNVFELCRRIRPGKLVTIGSACSYRCDHDLCENGFFQEPLRSTVECHGFSKLWMVAAHRAYRATYGLASPSGAGEPVLIRRRVQLERSHVVAALIKRYTGRRERKARSADGRRERRARAAHIDDLAELIIRSVERLEHEMCRQCRHRKGIRFSGSLVIAEQTGFRGATRWNPRWRVPRRWRDADAQVLGPFSPCRWKRDRTDAGMVSPSQAGRRSSGMTSRDGYVRLRSSFLSPAGDHRSCAWLPAAGRTAPGAALRPLSVPALLRPRSADIVRSPPIGQ